MESTIRLLVNVTTVLSFLLVLLISAGRLDYWQGWLYGAVSLAMSLATQIIMRRNPDLVRERLRPGAGAKIWDKKLLGLGLLLTLITLVVAGLDSGRYHWFPHLPWAWVVLGLILNVTGMSIFLLALKENRSSAQLFAFKLTGDILCA
jgi:hypothetical protein